MSSMLGLGVLLDLIRAVLAAALVGIAPGWFWAKVLCATADRLLGSGSTYHMVLRGRAVLPPSGDA